MGRRTFFGGEAFVGGGGGEVEMERVEFGVERRGERVDKGLRVRVEVEMVNGESLAAVEG